MDSSTMQLKAKIALLAILPLVVVAAAFAAVIALQASRLAAEQTATIDASLMQSKRVELEHYIDLALSAIGPLYASGRDDAATRHEAEAILARMNFGRDGYYFVYDLHGRSLVHPREPDIVGRNLWNLRDANGLPVIQRLVAAARDGTGFQRYMWRKPSTGKDAPKLGYVVLLPRWGWVVGTGAYLDDVERVETGLRRHVAASIRATMAGLALISLVAIALAGSVGMALNVSAHRLADRRLRELAQRIVTLQEDERARVARELHDGISQLLVSAKYQFELAQHQVEAGDGDPRDALDRGVGRIVNAISEVRRISHALHPILLDRLGVSAALGELARDFSERTSIPVRTRLPQEMPKVSFAAALTLFRIAQESLTNIERHAGATRASMRLEVDAAEARLRITDNGCGFDPGGVQARDGMGLRNIRERVDHLRGEVSLASSSRGTTIYVSLPLRTTSRTTG